MESNDIRKDYKGPRTTLKGSSGSVLFIQFIWQRNKFFATPQHQNIRMFWIFTQARERRSKNGKTRESEKKGTDPFLSHSIPPFLDCSMERTPKLSMLWDCGCTKGWILTIQNGNLEPLYIDERR
jgi:hypothetical protein